MAQSARDRKLSDRITSLRHREYVKMKERKSLVSAQNVQQNGVVSATSPSDVSGVAVAGFPPRPGVETQVVRVRLAPSELDLLRVEAQRRGWSMNATIRYAIGRECARGVL